MVRPNDAGVHNSLMNQLKSGKMIKQIETRKTSKELGSPQWEAEIIKT